MFEEVLTLFHRQLNIKIRFKSYASVVQSLSYDWLCETPWPGSSVHGILQARILEKWKWSSSVVSDSLWPHGLDSLPGSSVHGIFQARVLELVAISFPRDLPDPGIEPESPPPPRLAGRCFTTEPPGIPNCGLAELKKHWATAYRGLMSELRTWCDDSENQRPKMGVSGCKGLTTWNPNTS